MRQRLDLHAGGNQSVCQQAASEDKRRFGLMPNFRTSPSLGEYKPLTPRGKFKTAKQDSFDRGTVALGSFSAGVGHVNVANPSFGDGFRGCGKDFASADKDYVIGKNMTEALEADGPDSARRRARFSGRTPTRTMVNSISRKSVATRQPLPSSCRTILKIGLPLAAYRNLEFKSASTCHQTS